MTYFIADTHFGHSGIISLCDRPFANADEMDMFMVEMWNNKISGNDTVYIVGDMFYKHKEPDSMSQGYLKKISEEKWPCVSYEDIRNNREGVLVGLECTKSDLYQVWTDDEEDHEGEKLDALINKDYAIADYIELKPWRFYIDVLGEFAGHTSDVFGSDEEIIKVLLNEVAFVLKKTNKFAVAANNSNCITQRDELCFNILHMVAELTDMNRNLMMSIDVVPVPTDEAVREAESRLLGVETNITNWQRKQNQNNNFSATIPYDMEQQKKEMKDFLDDLTTRDQRMMFAVLTMVITAESKKQLDDDTEALLTTARKHLCQFAILKYQQMDGLNTVMPFGTRKIDAFRTLTTESLAVFIPFRVQDIYHENGIYYGQNVISKNMIIADRKQLLNGNEFILGVSGGGKSFAAKGEIINQVMLVCSVWYSVSL